MTVTGTSVVRLLMAAGVAVVLHSTGSGLLSGQSSLCGMLRNDAPVVFCETFDQPHPVTNRSGQLDGVIWGASRLIGSGTHWKASTIDGCNGPQAASPVGATDIIVCNGRLRQSSDDDLDVSVLALYPKQPFDFANRTGTVSFDVTNDTSGTHGTWPEFWLTDQPVPAPQAHLIPCDMCSIPRNSLGIRFAADRGSCPGGWRADSAIVTRNYVVEDRGIFENNTTGMQIRERGCASLSSGPDGGLNHVELRISQNQIDIYASDAGSTTLRLINTITNANLPMTRGLIWIQDSHYNAEKSMSDPTQKNHTFAWDNVAFDGPPTYRDLSYDVLDRNLPLANGKFNLGWTTTPSSPANLTTLPITGEAIAAATNALLMFNFGLHTTPSTFNYRVNGNVSSFASPLPSSLRGMRSIAMPVPLSHLVSGPQNIVLSTDVETMFSNVNLVLVAAAPVPGFGGPSVPSGLRIIASAFRSGNPQWMFY